MDDAKIKEVAHWYYNARNVPKPIIPFIKRKFGVDAGTAAKAITKAIEWRSVR